MALHTLHRKLATQAAAASVLDHVSGALHRGRLTDHAIVDALATAHQFRADFGRAVDGRTLFVAGQEECHRQAAVRLLGKELFGGHDKGRDRRLHVAGAATIQPAVAVCRNKRVAVPLLQRASGHHVGVAGKDQGANLPQA